MNKSPEYLTVTELGEVKQDKNDRNYRQIFFTGQSEKHITLPTGKVITAKTAPKTSSILAREASYLDDKPEFAWGLKKGDTVLGAVVTREVEPYDITTADGEIREVSTYTRVVFGDTTDPSFESLVKREFEAQDRKLANPVSEEMPVMAGSADGEDENF